MAKRAPRERLLPRCCSDTGSSSPDKNTHSAFWQHFHSGDTRGNLQRRAREDESEVKLLEIREEGACTEVLGEWMQAMTFVQSQFCPLTFEAGRNTKDRYKTVKKKKAWSRNNTNMCQQVKDAC